MRRGQPGSAPLRLLRLLRRTFGPALICLELSESEGAGNVNGRAPLNVAGLSVHAGAGWGAANRVHLASVMCSFAKDRFPSVTLYTDVLP